MKQHRQIQTVILCGGKGTRMGHNDLPKPLFPVGGKPLLWHIMSIYSHYGFNEFILCLGYKKEKIEDYFKGNKKWRITFVDTGQDTNTGERIKKIEKLIKADIFFATYGDGLSDVPLDKLLAFHLLHKKTATLISVRSRSQFGIISIDPHTSAVTQCHEKPLLDYWINGGFFVFNREVFSAIKENDVLEKETFSKLVRGKALVAYKHDGFWECMDTYKDNLHLNQLWNSGLAPWAVWHKK